MVSAYPDQSARVLHDIVPEICAAAVPSRCVYADDGAGALVDACEHEILVVEPAVAFVVGAQVIPVVVHPFGRDGSERVFLCVEVHETVIAAAADDNPPCNLCGVGESAMALHLPEAFSVKDEQSFVVACDGLVAGGFVNELEVSCCLVLEALCRQSAVIAGGNQHCRAVAIEPYLSAVIRHSHLFALESCPEESVHVKELVGAEVQAVAFHVHGEYPQVPVCVFHNPVDAVIVDGILSISLRIEHFHRVSVVPAQAVESGEPHESLLVLRDGTDEIAWQSVVGGYPLRVYGESLCCGLRIRDKGECCRK